MRGLNTVLRDKSFRYKLRMVALPVAFQNLINFGLNAADTIMLGRVGETQLAAAAVTNLFSFVFMVITLGLAAGCGVLMAQHWGAGDVAKVRRIMVFMYRIMAVLNLGFALTAILLPQYILGFIIADPEVIAEGIRFMRIIGISYAFWGLSNATIFALRATGVVNIAVVTSLCSLITNLTLNYLLIFGNFGFPVLGIVGAGIATTTSRILEFIILSVYIFRIEKRIGLRPADLCANTSGVGKSFARHGLPVVINEVFWVTGHFLLNVTLGRMGREAVAANAITGLMIQLIGVILFGLSSATGTVIGNTIGEGEHAKAREYANGMLAVSFFVGLLGFAIIQAVRLPIIGFHVLSPEAQHYAEQMTHVISIIVIFMSVAIISMMGTLRGGGDTKFVMWADIVFIWLIALPLGAFTGLVLGWPIHIVFMILRSEDVFKTILVLWRVPRGKWLKNVTAI